MFTSLLVCIFHVLYLATCAPTPEITLYDKIVEKCPSLASDSNYKNQPLFHVCRDWKTFNESLLNGNYRNVRCLLYFEAFTQYCTEAETPITTVPYDKIVSYQIEDICNYAKTVKYLSPVFSNLDKCREICTDNMGYVDTICSTSFYYAKARVVNQPPNTLSDSNAPTVSKKESQQALETSEQKVTASSKRPKTTSDQQELKTELAPETQLTQKNQVPDAKAIPEHSPDNTNTNAGNLKDSALNENIKHVVADIKSVLGALPNNATPISKDLKDSTPKENIKKTSAVVVEEKLLNSVSTSVKSQQLEQEKVEVKPVAAVTTVVAPRLEDLESQNVQEKNPNFKEDKNQITVPNVAQDEQPDQTQFKNNDLDDVPDQEDDEELPVDAPRDSKPLETGESDPVNYNTELEGGDSYFFTYFMILCVIFIAGYVCYHNKQKVLALILEGRRGRRQYRGRRPNSANYHKLDSNLEEAITSTCKKNTNNVIY